MRSEKGDEKLAKVEKKDERVLLENMCMCEDEKTKEGKGSSPPKEEGELKVCVSTSFTDL